MSDEKDNTQMPEPANDPGPIDDGQEVPAAPSLEAQLEAAKQEAAQLKDQVLRALAEAENVRRRAQREREDAAKYAITNFARDVLQVSDNLHRALEAIPQAALASDEALKNLHEGVSATERQLDAALERQQVKRIWPMGEKFDANLHQAMFEVPTTEHQPGTVVQVMQAGYTIHDRLLRPALVGVAKQPTGEAPPQGSGKVDTIA
ncbi:nucleotide exchange factor GrpE [Dongia deserti]|uniref:nucleotide exchange factor GrpE n=1 Tax=Dongia deserti TaxID=2268030 RepID=UPI000E64EE9D|nr:nucleotide exchange factor GrpE [Dongia deserti]